MKRTVLSTLGLAGVFLLALLQPCASRAASVVISEFMAQNTQTLADETGRYPDWIELHNVTSSAVSLDGWYLTDTTNNLTAWRIPAVTLPANGYLVVFASGKDRTNTAAPLHTNFQLNEKGEYLALVMPDGVTVASQFYPVFPNQSKDISYGSGESSTSTKLVASGATARLLAPANGALGQSWVSNGFDAAAWSAGPTGIGYSSNTVTGLYGYWALNEGAGSSSANAVPGGAAAAASGATWVNDPARGMVMSFNGSGNYATAGTIPALGAASGNFTWAFWCKLGASSAGTTVVILGNRYGGVASPLQFIKFTPSRFEYYHANAQVMLTYAVPTGQWVHLAVVKNGPSLVYYANGAVVATATATLDIAANAFYLGGDPGGEYANCLLDDVALWSSALPVDKITSLAGGANPLALGGYGSLIATDVRARMASVNASAYARIPFTLTENDSFNALRLRMRYDDGFVAWINGVEVARRNAPDTLAWNSAATAEHPYVLATAFEDIDITAALPRLEIGTNILAIQGLNAAASDSDFLLLPELEGVAVQNVGERFFGIPSPGQPNILGVIGYVADTKFSHDRGFYDTNFAVTISCATAGSVIRYTVNGTPPSETNGLVYSAPIPVTNTTTLRAVAFKPGWQPSGSDAQTYIFLDSILKQTGAGFPATWGGTTPDYAMDPAVVNDPRYAPTIRDDMKSLPVMSIVMDPADLFGAGGIYANPTARGPAWERACSVEYFYPDGSQNGFQVNCGIRLHGGASRDPNQSPKHSFNLLFKSLFGASKLNHKLFLDSDVESFNNIVLRANFNYTWARHDGDGPIGNPNGIERTHAQYTRDKFAKDLQMAMGMPGSHEAVAHLYINGLYWGTYNPCERTDASFAASYYGGDRTNYDAVFNDASGVPVANDGDMTAWNSMLNIANAGITNETAYRAIQQFCDVTNLADYMLLNFYLQTLDWPWQNWNAIRRRDDSSRFMFYVWDPEYTLEDLSGDRTAVGASGNEVNSPARFYNQLRAYPEFRVLFGDRVQKFMFNNGLLTPASLTNFYRAEAALVYRSIVGESARWGDIRRTPAYTRDLEWVAERDRLLNSWLGPRCPIVLQQLRTAGLYPSTVGAPVCAPFGGAVAGPLAVTLSSTNGTIYWTTNGEDPRVYLAGTVSPSARAYAAPFSFTNSVRLKARTYYAGSWSALTEAVYVSTNLPALRITELMNNPLLPEGSLRSADDYEFLELKNTGAAPLGLSGYSFDRGITFAFSNGVVLAPGQSLVIVASAAAFTERYGSGFFIAGEYIGRLSDSGETLRLLGAFGEVIQEFSYSSGIPLADGLGFSRVVRDPSAPVASWNDADFWRSSTRAGGSPGADDPAPVFPPVVVNEALANPVPPALSYIELYNPAASSVDLSGWFLTDDRMTPKKYRFPAGTVIEAGGFVAVDEALFHMPAYAADPFGLSASGEEVFLYSGDAATNLTGYSHGFAFDASAPGISFGRFLNSAGEESFPAQAAQTPGASNAGPMSATVVIQEIAYAATDGSRFVEIRNVTDNTLSMFDLAYPSNTWRVNGLGFSFPPGITLPGQGLIVITEGDAALFRARFAVPAEAQVFTWTGGLQAGGENLELQRPAVPTGANLDYITVDAVRFRSQDPWPAAAAGLGASLQKWVPSRYGNEPANWTGALPSPGRDLPGGAAPVITVAPVPTYGVAWQNVQLSVQAEGDAPLTFQWRLDGVNLPGANSPVLELPGVLPSQAGMYSVVVFNASGSVVSAPVALTLGMPPDITQQPGNVSALPGASVTMSVVASGTGPLTYQWRFNGLNITNATNAILSLQNLVLDMSGPYTVVVSDSIGPRLSQPGILTVLVKPLPTVPPPHFIATLGETVTFSASAYGSLPMGARWRRNSGTFVDYVTLKSNVAFLTLSNLTLTNAAFYTAVFTNYAAASPTLQQESPKGYLSMVKSPANQLALAGATATFRVPVSGQIPRYYAWEFNGAVLARGTNTAATTIFTNLLAINDMQPEKSGVYTFLITNALVYKTTNAGIVTTNWAPLGDPRSFSATLGIGVQVDPPVIDADPTNRTVLAGTNASFTVLASGGAPLRYLWFFNGTNLLAGQAANVLSLTNVQGAQDGGYSVVVTNSGGMATSQVAQLTVLLPPSIDIQPADVVRPAGAVAGFSVTASGSGTLKYQWYKGATILSNETAAILVLANVQPATEGAYKVVITNIYGAITSRLASLRVGVVPSILSDPADTSVGAGATALFNVTAAGDAPLAYQWYYAGSPLSGQTNPSLSLPNVLPAQAGDYFVVVTNSLSSVTSRVAQLIVAGAPLIDTQPADTVALPGSTARMTVAASGAAPLTYQWWFNATNLLAGQTGSELVLPGVQPVNTGLYHVVVANAAGSTPSRTARLVLTTTDTDGDGLPDWAEWIAGTDPLDPASVLKIDEVAFEGGSAALQFTAVSNRAYRVIGQAGVAPGAWDVLTNLPPAITNRQIRLLAPAGAGDRRFYRLEIPAAP